MWLDIQSGDTNNLDGAYKQKTVIAATNFASKFFDGPIADCDALFAVLVSPLERLGEVCCRAFSQTPSRLFKEASWVRVRMESLASAISPTVRTMS